MIKAPVWVRAAAYLAILAALAVLAAGPLTRLGVIDFRPAISMLGLGGILAGVAALVCLVAWFVIGRRRAKSGTGLAIAGFLAGAIAFGFVAMLLSTARGVPPIHDISTDTANPPLFVAVLPLRAGAANPPEYAGAEVAAQQASAYPDLRTLTVTATPEELYNKTLGAVKALGWELVDAAPAEGRIEATDTTAWFGFKDDIVIRITPTQAGALLDVRSKSRVGMSDLGANAARIRKLIERVEA